MFTDFRHVWQNNGAGPRFRIYSLDHNITQNLYKDSREFVSALTGMNPCEQERCMVLIAPKSATMEEMQRAVVLGEDYQTLMTEEVILQSSKAVQRDIE